ncbi:mercuric transport protein MerTP [bacterium]|nr:mercuric transport protein MerTP [bacterium]
MSNKQNIASTTGWIAAIAASSCCIAPVVAAIAGAGSLSASFSWLEPLRPYLIGFSIIAIGYAWYIHLKPKPKDDCGCEIVRRPKFYEGKSFLVVITTFAILSITFPSYSHLLAPPEKSSAIMSSFTTVELDVQGMTCTGCEVHVNNATTEIDGVTSSTSDYRNESAVVIFDPNKTDIQTIAKHIEQETGYSVRQIKK